MPRNLTPKQFAAKYQTSNNPTQSLGVDPSKYLQAFPDVSPDLLSGVEYFLNLLGGYLGKSFPSAETVISDSVSLLQGFNLTGPNSFWEQINSGPLAQDLQSLGTLINEQLGGTASTVNVFITDNAEVREMSAAGVQLNDNTVSVVNPVGIAFDSSDNLYIADSGNASVVMVSVQSVQTALEFTGLVDPVDVAVDAYGTVYVADNSGAVYKLTSAGVQTQLNFTGLVSPTAIDVDGFGDVYVADSGAAKVYKMTSGGTQSTLGFTGLTAPQGVCVDGLLDVYVTDGTHVYMLNVFNSQTTVGFTGLSGPKHIDTDSAGSVYVVDGTQVYRLGTTGTQTSLDFIGLTAPVGIAVQNAQWADIEVALQQIKSQSDANWNALLADFDLSGVTTGGNSFTDYLNSLLPTNTYQSLVDGIANAFGHTGTGHTWAQLETYFGIIPGPNIATPVSTSVIPSLDASKITTGTFAQSFVSGLASSLASLLPSTTYQSLLDGIANVMGQSGTGHTLTQVETYLGLIPGPNIATPVSTSIIPSLDASKITTGTFAQSFVSGLASSLSALLPATTYQALLDNISNAMGQNGTGHTLAQVESYLGLIPGANIASAVSASVVPSLDASKITTGTFAQSFVSGLTSLWNSWFGTTTPTGSSTLNAANVAALPASKITTGTFTTALIPSLDASKITTGTFAQSFVSGLTSLWNSWFGTTTPTGTSVLNAANIAPLPASQITSGTFGTALIPSLDASKITTGTFAQSFVSGLAASLSALLPTTTYQSLLDNISNAMGQTGTGHTLAQVESYLGLIPGANIASAVSASVVPSLDASKITTGTFAQSFVSGLSASLSALLPTTTYQSLLDNISNAMGVTGTGHTLAQVESYLGLIPGGNIASAVSASVVPSLDASKITTGTFAQSFVSGLASSLAALLPTTTYQSLLDNISNAMGVTGTGHTLAQVESYLGLIPGGNIASAVSASVVPSLDASKITTGTFAQSFVSGLTSLWNSWFGTTTPTGTSVLNAANIASLPASQITSGTFTTSLIPLLPASQITSGTFGTGQIPALDASKITTGTFAQSFVSGLTSLWNSWFGTTTPTGTSVLNAANVAALPASKITTGTFTTALIPALDASKITTGTLANSFVPGALPQLGGISAASNNMVISPDFEDTTVARTSGSNGGGIFAYSTAVARSGTHCFSITTGTSTNNDYFFLSPHTLGTEITNFAGAAIKVQPGQWIYGEIYVRGKSTNTTTAGTVQLGAFLQDSTGVNAAAYPSIGSAVTQSGLSSTAWTKLSGWYQIPAGYDRIIPIAWTNGANVTAQTFYFDDARVVEATQAQSIAQQLFGSGTILSTILAAAVPSLDASKITTGTFAQSFVSGLTSLWNSWFGTPTPTGSSMLNAANVGPLPASQITSGTFGTGQIPALDASKITTGTFAQSFVSGLASSLAALLPTTTYQSLLDNISNAMGFSGTGHTLAQVESYLGLIPGGNIASAVSASVVPSLDASKITTGTFAQSFVSGLTSLWNSWFGTTTPTGTSVLNAANIASLPASQITSGTFTTSLIPSLPASQITSGTFGTGQIPALDASKITTGTFAQSFVSGLASSLAALLPTTTYQSLLDNISNAMGVSGTGHTLAQVESYLGLIPGGNISSAVSASVVPSLDASKITTGTFAQSFVSGLASSLAALLPTTTYQSLLDNISNAMGVSGTGHTLAQVESYLGLIPGGNIASAVSASVVPSLDASKITTGTFAQSFVSGLTSLWNSWFGTTTPTGTSVLNAANIASLPASQITSGTFGTALIPALDASKLTTGTLGLARIPALPTTQITSGTFLSNFLPIFGLSKAAGSNLILDPGFESATNWTHQAAAGTGSGTSTDYAHGGTHSFKMVGSGGSIALYLNGNDIAATNPIHTTGGEIFQISAWVYLPTANTNSGSSTIYLDLNLADSTGVHAATNVSKAFAVSGITEGVWTYITANLTVPSGYDTFNPIVWIPASTSGDLYYIDDVITRETTLVQSTINSLFSGGTIASTILATAVPSLDASKITTGTFAQSFVSGLTSLWNSWFGTTTPTGTSVLNAANIASLPASQITSGVFGTGQIPALDASKITTGTFAQSFVSGLTSLWNSWFGTTTPTGTSVLNAANVASLPASQITSGTFTTSLIPSLPASQITSGTFGTGQIPALDASKITTGTFAQSFVSGLAASLSALLPTTTYQSLLDNISNAMGVSGTGHTLAQVESYLGLIPGGNIASAVSASVVPSLDASKITSGSITGATVPGSQLTGSVLSSLLSGAVAIGLIPSLPASQITSGTFGTGQIPALDASKITTGTFAQSFVSGLTSLWNSWFGTTTPTGTSQLAAANVAALPASQITSGTFGAGLIPSLDASKITSGSLTGATVPGSQLTGSVLSSLLSGAVALGLIPALPATQITSGTFGAGQIPSLDASKIVSGTLANTMVANAIGGSSLGADLSTLAANIAAIFGAPTTGTVQAQANQGLSNQAANTAANAAAIAALQATAAQSQASGLNVNYTFSQYATSSQQNVTAVTGLGALKPYAVYGDGNWIETTSLQGGALGFGVTSYQSGGTGNGQCENLLMYSGAQFQTDFQQASGVFYQLGTGAAYFVLRANSATAPSTYMLCIITPSYVQLYKIVSGTATQIGSTVYTSVANGAVLQFQAGVSGAARNYQLLMNGNPIATWTGSTESYGSGYRWGGMGANSTSGYTNFSWSSFGLTDNVPPPIQGSKLRVANNNTGSGPTLVSGSNKLTTYFNTIVEQTADISYSTSTGIATVSAAGIYAVKIRLLSYSSFTNQRLGVCVYHAVSGGTPSLYENGYYGYQSSPNAIVSDTFFIPCQAGDQIQAGCQEGYGTSGSIITGDSGLTNTAFEIVLCNTSVNG